MAFPALGNLLFIFCIKLSSFHLVNISMPYAVQSEAICCSLLSFTFRTAMAVRTYNTSGTYLLLPQYLVLGGWSKWMTFQDCYCRGSDTAHSHSLRIKVLLRFLKVGIQHDDFSNLVGCTASQHQCGQLVKSFVVSAKSYKN